MQTQSLKETEYITKCTILAYQHPVALGVALMVEEAIVMASTSLKICGKSIVECLGDMEAYTNLHDGIFYLVIITKLSKLLASFSVI